MAEKKVFCPICQSAAESIFVKREGDYDLWQCCACQLWFSDPMSAPLETFYQESPIYENRSEDSVMDRGMRNYDWRYQTFFKLFSSKARPALLDIGCGDGKFILCAKDKGFNVFGIDIDERAVNFMKNVRKLEQVERGGWEEVKEIEKWKNLEFDIITLFDVLEHSSSPSSLAETVFGLLKSSGQVCISVPRLDRYPRIFDAEVDSPPHHFTLWTARALTTLFKKAGFSEIQIMEKPLMLEDLLLHLIKRTKRSIGKIKGDHQPDSKRGSLVSNLRRCIFLALVPLVIAVNWIFRTFCIGKGHTLLLKARKPSGKI